MRLSIFTAVLLSLEAEQPSILKGGCLQLSRVFIIGNGNQRGIMSHQENHSEALFCFPLFSFLNTCSYVFIISEPILNFQKIFECNYLTAAQAMVQIGTTMGPKWAVELLRVGILDVRYCTQCKYRKVH